MTVKGNQGQLHRQIRDQFQYGRRFPINATHTETGHGRSNTWTIRAREATEAIRRNWYDSAWIVELTTTGRRNHKPFRQAHYFLTSVRTAPKGLLRLVRQRWAIENEWHWARDVQLGEDAHGYRHRVGAPLVSFLRTVAMNLLRLDGFRSIRAGLQEVAHDISRMLSLAGITPEPAPG
jgi:predicted transposase YbfD/YdcC